MTNLTINYFPLNFQSNSQTAPRRGASDGGRLSCHRMAHYVLIRCFLQLSLAEALCECNFFSIRDRQNLSEVRIERNTCPSPHGASLIRCFLQLSLAEALRWCNFFSIRLLTSNSPRCGWWCAAILLPVPR